MFVGRIQTQMFNVCIPVQMQMHLLTSLLRKSETISSEPDYHLGEFTKASKSRVSETIIIVAPPFVVRKSLESLITFHCDDDFISYLESELPMKFTLILNL